MDRDRRIAAVRRRLVEMRRDERRAEAAGPPCRACLHFSPRRTSMSGAASGPYCTHLANGDRRFDPVSGRFEERFAVAPERARAADGLCGSEALLFEPASPGRIAARLLRPESGGIAGPALLTAIGLVGLLLV